MITRFKSYYVRQQFHPTLAGIFLNPFWIARRGLRRSMGENAKALDGRLLDVGCGSKPYRKLFSVSEYVGLEIESPSSRRAGNADFYYDGKQFPFDDASFDSILCNQVLEHVFDPQNFLSEIGRVLRPGGRLLLTIPFVWDEHEQPFDFARYSSFGLKSLLERHGFEVERQEKIGTDFSVIVQLVNAYIFKVLPENARVRLFATLALMAPITALGTLLTKALPKNPDLYLDQLVLARKV
ncbi:class I SAM-dependent methyltransferase [Indioceanicola profundi]|uniref:class I SAM-dependent methyltransferase n=1 Tax=Indioceanicola profundi TaxID=2220096 RepID=UPI000E6AA6E6|nr:class I SAM-dependent methyltransferase [Indioceanicola profundi]